MIADKLVNIKLYSGLGAIADEVLAFVERAEKEQLPVGRYDLHGDDLFALIQTYNSKTLADGRMESHKLYDDLQYIMEGEECIYWDAISDLKVEEDQTPEKDMIFYERSTPKGSTVLTAGMFGYYLPTDGHMPGITTGEIAPVKKIVFKIKCK